VSVRVFFGHFVHANARALDPSCARAAHCGDGHGRFVHKLRTTKGGSRSCLIC